MKKRRADSLYAALKPTQRTDLFEALHNGEYVAKGVELCASWGVRTSMSAVSHFYSDHLCHLQDEQLKLAKEVARQAGNGPQFDQATSAMASQQIFEKVLKMKLEPRLLLTLRKIAIEEKKIEVAKERMVSKLDAGLDQLFSEIKGNPKALAIYEQLREALKK